MSPGRIPSTDWALALMKAMAASRHYKTQIALSRKSGVPQATIGRILRKVGDTQCSNLERIARVLGLSLSKLAEMGQAGEPIAESTDLGSVERSTTANEEVDRLWALLTAEFQEVRALRAQIEEKENRAIELAEELRSLTTLHQQETQHG